MYIQVSKGHKSFWPKFYSILPLGWKGLCSSLERQQETSLLVSPETTTALGLLPWYHGVNSFLGFYLWALADNQHLSDLCSAMLWHLGKHKWESLYKLPPFKEIEADVALFSWDGQFLSSSTENCQVSIFVLSGWTLDGPTVYSYK